MNITNAGTNKTMEDTFSMTFNELESTLNDIAMGQDEEDEEEDSYIEIDLQPSLLSGELELRISFSCAPSSSVIRDEGDQERKQHICHGDQASIPSFRFPITRSLSSSMVSARASFSDELQLLNLESSPESDTGASVKGTGVLAGRGKVKVSPSELGAAPASRKEHRRLIGKSKNKALVGSRKQQATTSLSGGVMMKFLIKLRSGKLLSTFMSFIKSYNYRFFPPFLFKLGNYRQKQQETLYKCPRSSNPFQKWMELVNTNYLTDDDGIAALDANHAIARIEPSKLVEIMDMNKSMKHKKGNLLASAKSLPATWTKSPVRSRAGNDLFGKLTADDIECSVMAAIAHCKRSFGDPGIARQQSF